MRVTTLHLFRGGGVLAGQFCTDHGCVNKTNDEKGYFFQLDSLQVGKGYFLSKKEYVFHYNYMEGSGSATIK